MSLPFDPTQTGPQDLVRDAKAWASDNSIVLIPSMAAVVIALIIVRPEVSIPTWFKVFLAASIGASVIAYLPGKTLIEFLYQPETVVLAEVDPASGDLAVHELSPDRFSEITVVDHDGTEKPQSFLHKISTSKGVGYECDTYDIETNTATATWMAGASNHEIRASEHTVRRIQNDLSIRADRVFDLETNLEHVIREALSEIANSMIRTSQGMRVPQGDLIADAVNDVLDREVPDALDTASKQSDEGETPDETDDAQNDAQGAEIDIEETDD